MCRIMSVPDVDDVLEICDIGLCRYADAVMAGGIRRTDAVPCLLRLNLLAPGQNEMFTAIPPATAAQLTIEPLRQRMARHQQHVLALEPSFAAAAAAYAAALQDASGEVRTILGAAAINAALGLAIEGCATELFVMQPGGWCPPEYLDRALSLGLPGLRRGVRQRTIYQHSARTHPPTMDDFRETTRAGGDRKSVV